jgi:hypothetical protein
MTGLEIPRHHRMVETAMDAYCNWREEARAVSQAYQRWADSRQGDAESAWGAYEDARDAEEHASLLYMETARRSAAGARGMGHVVAQGAAAR